MRNTLLLAFCILASAAGAQTRAIPTAEGYAAYTVHGSGRATTPPKTTVYRVTNLNDTGAGSFRACAEATGSRVCIFDTSGRVDAATEVTVTSGNLWIAGQTAPSPGFMLTGAGLVIKAANDVLVQHIEVRPGDRVMRCETIANGTFTGDGISILYSKRVILDHVSVSWGIDENIGFWSPSATQNASDVTIQYSIIAEGLGTNESPDTVNRTGCAAGNGKPHAMGMLVGRYAKNISVHHNLIAHNWDRNIQVQSGTNGSFASNLIYNWGGASGNRTFNPAYSTAQIPLLWNVLGNYYKRGPNSQAAPGIFNDTSMPTGSLLYLSHNIGPTRPTDTGAEWAFSGLATTYQSMTAVDPENVSAHWADQTTSIIPASAGARPWNRNATDTRILADVAAGTGTRKDCLTVCDGVDVQVPGGYPTVAVNTRTLALPDVPDGDCDQDGLTNLEEYLTGLQG